MDARTIAISNMDDCVWAFTTLLAPDASGIRQGAYTGLLGTACVVL